MNFPPTGLFCQPFPSPLPGQGGIEQHSATTSLPPHLYQVRRGSVPYPSPPCKGWHVPWVRRGSLCCLSSWLTCMEGESLCYCVNLNISDDIYDRKMSARTRETYLMVEAWRWWTVTPHKTWLAVPSVAWGTGLRSAASSHLPLGSWIREGSDMKRQLKLTPICAAQL